jgi:exosortase D (VPLPA-CTERM-specific)
MNQTVGKPRRRLISAAPVLAPLLACILIVFWTFDEAAGFVLRSWRSREFAHAPLILMLAAFMMWNRRSVLSGVRRDGRWTGVVLCALGAATAIAGQLASLFVVTQYGMLACLYGTLLAVVGWPAFRALGVPLLLLLFLVPLPQFLRVNLVAILQSASAAMGVGVLRWSGVSVYSSSNLLDFGAYTLRLDDVGAGLRHLFALLALSFVVATTSRGRTWRRLLLFLSTWPLMVTVNGVLFALVVLLADRRDVAEITPFLQEQQPWLVFIVSAVLLALGAWALQLKGSPPVAPGRAGDRGVEASIPSPASQVRPAPALAATAVLVITAAVSPWLVQRPLAVPTRASLATFPAAIGPWVGRRSQLEPGFQNVLKLDDYLLADYRAVDAPPVNLYVAWYDSQQAGRSAHSPRACLPGDGWRIEELRRVPLPGIDVEGHPLWANRAVIGRGPERQLVYYWFQQRGRVLTSEYLVKAYLFWDLLTRRRSDGALIRLTVPLRAGSDPADADREVVDFARQAMPLLESHVPG